MPVYITAKDACLYVESLQTKDDFSKSSKNSFSLTFNFISTCFFNSKGVHKSFSKSTRKDNETLLDGQMICWWNLKNSMSEMPLLSDQTLEGKV